MTATSSIATSRSALLEKFSSNIVFAPFPSLDGMEGQKFVTYRRQAQRAVSVAGVGGGAT